MYLKIIALNFVILICLIQIKCEENISSITYVDEVVILKKLFSNLQDMKKSIDLLNLRYEENFEHKTIQNKDLPVFDIRFDELPLKCQNQSIPKNCAEATSCTHRSGIYKIKLNNYHNQTFLVECDVKTQGGDWLIIQRRQDGSVDFYRDWDEYEKGFGQIQGEFFIGLEKLHALTNYDGPQELLMALEDLRYSKYNNFVIGDKSSFYALQHLGVYTGDAGDSFSYHLGCKFSTKDQDHDEHETHNCTKDYTGAWWYKSCHESNLNGKHGDNTYGKGLTWKTFRNYNISLKHVKMMIRRRRF